MLKSIMLVLPYLKKFQVLSKNIALSEQTSPSKGDPDMS